MANSSLKLIKMVYLPVSNCSSKDKMATDTATGTKIDVSFK